MNTFRLYHVCLCSSKCAETSTCLRGPLQSMACTSPLFGQILKKKTNCTEEWLKKESKSAYEREWTSCQWALRTLANWIPPTFTVIPWRMWILVEEVFQHELSVGELFSSSPLQGDSDSAQAHRHTIIFWWKASRWRRPREGQRRTTHLQVGNTSYLELSRIYTTNLSSRVTDWTSWGDCVLTWGALFVGEVYTEAVTAWD